MRTTNKLIRLFTLLLATALALVLSACGSSNADTTPTLSVEEIFTAAVQTFAAQQATQLALTPPTGTPSPTLFPTLPPPTLVSPVAFASATSVVGGQSACDNSAWIADVTIPDGTILKAGETFVKSWLLQNTGSCAWNPSYKLSYDSGDQMGGTDAYVNINVPVNQQLKISVNLTAPTATGNYKGFWRLQNDKSQPFGSIIWVQIKVGAASTATTAAASETPTETPTP